MDLRLHVRLLQLRVLLLLLLLVVEVRLRLLSLLLGLLLRMLSLLLGLLLLDLHRLRLSSSNLSDRRSRRRQRHVRCRKRMQQWRLRRAGCGRLQLRTRLNR